MSHGAGFCLSAWTSHLTWGPPLIRPCSTDGGTALELMEWIWERNPYALIRIDEVYFIAETTRHFTGPTFPVRVCRAAIWLAMQNEKDR